MARVDGERPNAYKGLDIEDLSDSSDHVVVDCPRSGDNATVVFKPCSVREIERHTSYVRDTASSLLDDKFTGSVIPDFLSVVRSGGKSKINRCVATCDCTIFALAIDSKWVC